MSRKIVIDQSCGEMDAKHFSPSSSIKKHQQIFPMSAILQQAALFSQTAMSPFFLYLFTLYFRDCSKIVQ